MANTHIVPHAGKLLALEETHLPVEIGSDLSTIGSYSFDGRLKSSMTAHPKTCPKTGELHFFGYGITPPYLTYHMASPSGSLLRSTVIPVKKPTMMHDFHITKHYAVFMDLPLTIDPAQAGKSGLPIRWDDEYGARLAVVPRDQKGAVMWFEIDPSSAGHAMNAYEDGDDIVMDVCSKSHVFKPGIRDGKPLLYRWRLNVKTGKFRKTRLSEDPIEFPRIADANIGLPYTYGYAAVLDDEHYDRFRAIAIRKFNMQTGDHETFAFDRQMVCGEPVFAPRTVPDSEDDGYILVYANDELEESSTLCVFDAQNIVIGPMAEVRMPTRVPQGLHGTWIND